MKARVGLLGSCVTRDPLSLIADDVGIAWYQARTSIPSMATPPIHLPLTFRNGATPPFEQRNAHFDLAKSWLSNIRRSDYDVLLLDFVDERFGCMDFGNSYFTWSTSIRAGELPHEARERFRWVSPLREEYMSLIDKYFMFVADELRLVGKPVVCNDVLWVFEHSTGRPMENFQAERFGAMNDVLKAIYARIGDLPNVTMLGLKQEALTLEVNHRWGDAPFHYDDKTNYEISRRLKELMGI